MIGSSLTTDKPTAELSGPSMAKVYDQIDMLEKKLSSRVWIGCGDTIPGY